MINYSKVRESVDKVQSKKSLSRASSINKTHTSSVNMKLSQDINSYENMRVPLKSIFQQKCQPYLQSHSKNAHNPYIVPQKKYSAKLSNNDKENIYKRKENYDMTALKSYQQSNRYMETERVSKECTKYERSISKKSGLKIKAEASKQMKTEYIERSIQKTKKDASTRLIQKDNNIVKISVNQIQSLVQELLKNQNQVQQLHKQLQFYRQMSTKMSKNSVLMALKV